MTGIDVIAAERERQQKLEEFDFHHDDQHANGELSSAAAAYVLLACDQLYPEKYCSFDKQAKKRMDTTWPWDEEYWKPDPNVIRNLAKAGALIAAEIDRLKRMEE